jgi:hypothetical protein
VRCSRRIGNWTARWTVVTLPSRFPNDRHRVEDFFALYEQLDALLGAAAKPARKGRKQQAES